MKGRRFSAEEKIEILRETIEGEGLDPKTLCNGERRGEIRPAKASFWGIVHNLSRVGLAVTVPPDPRPLWAG
jgi:hypothetical protein